MTAEEIEEIQRNCFREDFRQLGPSISRSVETWLLGYLKLKDSPNPMLRKKADMFASEVRKSYPVFLSGKLLGPTPETRRWIGQLQKRIHAHLGKPTLVERALSVGAVGLAAWTGLKLKLDLGQHPRLIRNTFRFSEQSLPARVWNRLRQTDASNHHISVELRPESTVWVRVEGKFRLDDIKTFVADLRSALKQTEDRLVLDLAHWVQAEKEMVERFGEGLKEFYDRIRIVLPRTGEIALLGTLFAIYS